MGQLVCRLNPAVFGTAHCIVCNHVMFASTQPKLDMRQSVSAVIEALSAWAKTFLLAPRGEGGGCECVCERGRGVIGGSRLMEQPSMGIATRWERKTQKPTAIGASICNTHQRPELHVAQT